MCRTSPGGIRKLLLSNADQFGPMWKIGSRALGSKYRNAIIRRRSDGKNCLSRIGRNRLLGGTVALRLAGSKDNPVDSPSVPSHL